MKMPLMPRRQPEEVFGDIVGISVPFLSAGGEASVDGNASRFSTDRVIFNWVVNVKPVPVPPYLSFVHASQN